MRDVYCIGELLIDFIPGKEPFSYIRNAGGAPANVAIAVAKNHLQAGMCCAVGDDQFGYFLYDTLKENQVECIKKDYCKEAITTMAIVTLAEDGERTFTFVRKPGADMFVTEEDIKEEDIRNYAIIHAGSLSLSAMPVCAATEKAMRLGAENKRIVSFDVNYRNFIWENDEAACAKKVKEVLPYVDILKISEEEVDMMGGEDHLFDLMKEYGITLIVETLGSKGARCYFQGEIFDVEGRKAKAVDATGAGDAFWGGFLSSLRKCKVEKIEDITREVIERSLAYGNVAGWICVQKKGAIASLPTDQEIESYL